MIFKNYNSHDPGELVASLPGYGKKVVVFSLCIDDILVGDVLWVAAEIQCSNEQADGVDVLFGAQVLLAPLASSWDKSSSAGVLEISPENGLNIIRDMHHGLITKAASYTVLHPSPKAFVNVICWTGKQYNRPLVVNSGFGKLSIIKLRV